jgi:hypothetical protein
MEAYQERVVEEREQLGAKIDKLGSFVSSDVFKTVDDAEQKRLRRQLTIMQQYLQVLNERIAEF